MSNEEYLKENDPELLAKVFEMMAKRDGWDIADCWDAIDSESYHAYCESDE